MPFKTAIDLTGRKFGMLTVRRRATVPTRGRSALWYCECECGRFVDVRAHNLRPGNKNYCSPEHHPEIRGIRARMAGTRKQTRTARAANYGNELAEFDEQ